MPLPKNPFFFKDLSLQILGTIGVAREGAQEAPPPIKIPPMIKNYDNTA